MDPLSSAAGTKLILDQGLVGALIFGMFTTMALATRLWFVWRADVAKFEQKEKEYQATISGLQDKRIEMGREVTEQVLKSTSAMDGFQLSNERLADRVDRLHDRLIINEPPRRVS